jgi:hypothetical protein
MKNSDCDGSDAAPAADKNKTMNNANRDKSDGTFFLLYQTELPPCSGRDSNP